MSRNVGRFASAALSVLAFLVVSVSPGAADPAGEDHPPIVTAPATQSGTEFQLLTFVVTASDPDGQPIETLTASGLPSGATFAANASNTSGTFSWTPASGQAGSYTVTFTATNHTGTILRTGSATTAITIATGDHPPTIAAPAGAIGEEGGVIAFTVSAEDPDGDPISSLTANLASLPTGNDASFTPTADNTSGQFAWHPQAGNAGTYSVTFTATSNLLSATASTTITVAPAGTGATGLFVWTPQLAGTYQVVFTATDAGGSSTFTSTIYVTDPLSATQAPGTNLSGRAPTALSPQAPQKGPVISGTGSSSTSTGSTTTLSVYSSDGTLLSAQVTAALKSASISQTAASAQSIDITADLSQTPGATFTVDHQPLVAGLASVTIDAGTNLSLQISAADPDGDDIDSFTADLSALPAGNNATFTTNVSHTVGTLTWTPGLSDAGTYAVSYTATNRLVGHGSTMITVNPAAATRVFMTGGQKIRLSSNKPTVCLQIEPIDGSFNLLDVNLATVRMVSLGTGSVSEIPAITGKTVLLGDRDNNQIPDLSVCFLKSDLRQLFSLVNGKQTLTITVRGQTYSGAYFAGSFTTDVVGSGGPALAAALVWPNPLNPSAKLSFIVTKPGMLRVGLYDAQGRLVRELANEQNAGIGTRELTIDGKGGNGAALASGVYYYRIETAAGTSSGRLAIVR